jgi:uncharacterized RmlC-like cupin family protein
MDWAKQGVKIVHSDELDLDTPQTSGMTRAAAITHARAGANKLWAGTMLVQPDAKTGPHEVFERFTRVNPLAGVPDAGNLQSFPCAAQGEHHSSYNDLEQYVA